MLSIKMPTCTGVINIASATLKVDFRKNARTVELLGKDNLEKNKLSKQCSNSLKV